MAKDVNINIKAKGGPQTKRQIEEVGRSTQRAGDHISRAGSKASKTSSGFGLLGKAANSLKTTVLGFISGTTILAFLKSWLDRINKIIEAQEKLAKSTETLQESAKGLAIQYGDLSDAGLTKAATDINTIRKAARITSSQEARDIGIAGDVAFGRDRFDLTLATAEFSGRNQLGGDAIGSLFKLLINLNVKSMGDLQQRLQQIQAVQALSPSLEPAAFLTGAIKGVTQSLAAGATFESALANFARAIQLGANETQAAELNRQLNQLTAQPKIINAVSKTQGITSTEFRGLPFDEQKLLIGQYIAARGGTGAGRELLTVEGGLSPDQLLRSIGFYSPEGLREIQKFRTAAGAATPEEFLRRKQEFSITQKAKREEIAADTQIKLESATQATLRGQSVVESVEADFLLLVQAGKDDPFVRDSIEKQRMIRRRLLNRIRQLRSGGRLSAERARVLTQMVQDKLIDPGIRVDRRGVGISGFQKFEPEFIGQISTELDELEFSTPAVAPITNINFNTNHNYNPIGSTEDRTRTPSLSPN